MGPIRRSIHWSIRGSIGWSIHGAIATVVSIGLVGSGCTDDPASDDAIEAPTTGVDAEALDR